MKLLELIPNKAAIGATPMLAMATDSAIINRGRPVFLPDIAGNWSLAVAPAFRISRLGKSIPARFAYRYVDAVTIAARLIAGAPMSDGLDSQAEYSPWLTAFDGAYALGRWVEIPELARQEEQHSIEMSSPEVCRMSFSFSDVAEAIGMISRTFTVKSGDVVIPGLEKIIIPVKINDHVEASLDNQTILSYNIK